MENKTWREQFDEKFGYKPHPNYGFNYELKADQVKSFISHLLTAQLEKIEEGIQGMGKLPTEDQESGLEEEEEEEEDEAYDQALTDVLDLISKLKEKS